MDTNTNTNTVTNTNAAMTKDKVTDMHTDIDRVTDMEMNADAKQVPTQTQR